MKIALIGYGKMGKAIEKIAIERGHEIILKISRNTIGEFTPERIKEADVAIEFTTPDSALENVTRCLDQGVPVVCGTTGWNDKLRLAQEKCLAQDTAFLQASNFSVGVNLFFELNTYLAQLMNNWPEYGVSVEETHHTEKKDAPSGTAITILEQIIDKLKRKERWVLNGDVGEKDIPVQAHRIEHVPGTHKVKYASAIDEIEIIHTAYSREGFAYGSVLAAEYIQKRKGVFSMRDVLFLSQK